MGIKPAASWIASNCTNHLPNSHHILYSKLQPTTFWVKHQPGCSLAPDNTAAKQSLKYLPAPLFHSWQYSWPCYRPDNLESRPPVHCHPDREPGAEYREWTRAESPLWSDGPSHQSARRQQQRAHTHTHTHVVECWSAKWLQSKATCVLTSRMHSHVYCSRHPSYKQGLVVTCPKKSQFFCTLKWDAEMEIHEQKYWRTNKENHTSLT